MSTSNPILSLLSLKNTTTRSARGAHFTTAHPQLHASTELRLQLHFSERNRIFGGVARGAELDEEFVEVLAGELPFEGLSGIRPVVLKVQQALSNSVEIGKIVGCQDLPLDDREVDFKLVEPTGMNRRMHECEAWVEIPQTLSGSRSAMRRAVVHDPEDATGVVIRRSCHHLLDKPVKGCDAILFFATTENPGPVDVQGCDVGPGAATEILMLDMHGSPRTATLCGVFAATSLNAGLFIGGDYELVILQRPALPLSGVEIQYAAGLGGEIRIAGEYPATVIPRPNGVLMQPAPQRAATDRGHQAALVDLLNQITGAPAGQRQAVLGRQFTGQRFNLNDEIWGKKSGGDPDERVLPTQRGGR
jgi:hypothetical protein